jgi:hypothetical protein
MPADWRLLPIGDPAWVTIYGDRPSGVEGQVRDGTIQDFALPLLSRDARLLSLAVYVRSTAVGTTLETLADGYQDVLTSTVINGYGPGTLIDRKTVDLPAGPAVRLESTLPYTRDGGIQSPPAATHDASRDDHVVAWVLQHGTRAYYLVFRGNERIIGDHDIEFGCMAGSLEFTSPNP